MIDEEEEQFARKINNGEQAILCDRFTFFEENATAIKSRVLLFQDSLAIIPQTQHSKKCKIEFDFDTVFQIMKINVTEEEINTHSGRPVGIRLEKFQESVELENSDNEVIGRWNMELGKRLNQRNFHQIFKPVKKIGKGNFASVYLVVKNQNKVQYAVKAFSKDLEYAEDRGKQSLQNEVKVMRAFNHDNLMKIEGVYETENSIYMVVEYLKGGVLYEKIKERYKFTTEEIRTIMKSLLEGVAAMHAQNIMHRDLKPENILLRDQFDFNCVIGDFGLATYAHAKQFIYTRCGTPGYVAPEISNLKDSNARYGTVCDIFSLGVIFHILATSKSPFPGREADEVLRQNRECNINFSLPLYGKLPEEWLDLLKRMLDKSPQTRITAEEALRHRFFIESNPDIPEELSIKSFEECESPLMITKNNRRKRNVKLRDDSCLKFKMKDNLMGELTENAEQVDKINSPVSTMSKKIQRERVRNEKKSKTIQPSNFRQ